MPKVFQLNECDWYAAEDEESAIQCAMDDCGMSYEDVVDDSCIHELGDEEMKRLKIVDDGVEMGTFEWALAKMVSNGQNFPCFFASTEF